MIEKWLKLLAGFLVDAAFAKLGIKDANDLVDRLVKAFRAEISDELDKIESIPERVVVEVGTQLGNITGQIIDPIKTAINNLIPPWLPH